MRGIYINDGLTSVIALDHKGDFAFLLGVRNGSIRATDSATRLS